MVVLLIIYWVIAIGLLPVGLILLIVAKDDEDQRRKAIKLLIASLILIIIGGGICGLILMNLNLGQSH